MIAGIAIDDWKLGVFHRHLKAAGFEYVKKPGLTKDTLLLQVTCRSQEEIEPIVRAANDECRRAKAN